MNKKMPYIPEGRKIKYVTLSNPFMQQAQLVALKDSLDPEHRTGAVIVRSNFFGGARVLAAGANGSVHHLRHGCERKKLKIPTGEGYDLCEGCSPHNHAEQKAIKAFEGYNRYNDLKIKGCDLYLWGHWWCCESCWDSMIAAGIRDVYLEKPKEK